MTYLSVCAGIEAATVAWHPLGWEAAAFSEIEPFACAVLAHHWPMVPNLGDMTAYKEWKLCDCNTNRQHELPDKTGQAGAFRRDRESGRPMLHPVKDSPSCGRHPGGFCAKCGKQTVDLLVGGTPCQSFSVAGLRAGLDDPRGSLMLVYLAIARRFAPRWVVWENVPGVLSSHRGRDFGTFLGGLAECGYGFAYRVLDAQFFGVPQRRRRVFVVGYLGDWRAAAAVLFERESLRGYPAPSREAGERVAGTVDAGAHPGGFNGRDAETDKLIAAPLTRGADSAGKGGYAGRRREDDENLVAYAVNAHGGSGRMDGESETFVSHALRADGFDASEDGTGRGTPLIGVENASTYEADASSMLRVLRQEAGTEALAEWGSRILDSLQSPEVLRPWLHGESIRRASDSFRRWVDDRPLACEESMSGRTVCKMWKEGPDGRTSQGRGLAKQLAFQLGKALPQLPHQGASRSGVRRLTPRECERLMGLPDDYTAIPYHGRLAADGPRYRALGNSMAVPVMRWLGERIEAVRRNP